MNEFEAQIVDSFNSWLGHYTKNGFRHYKDTNEDRLPEIYFDECLERVLDEVEGDPVEIEAILNKHF